MARSCRHIHEYEKQILELKEQGLTRSLTGKAAVCQTVSNREILMSEFKSQYDRQRENSV